jgi:hypothetical protein
MQYKFNPFTGTLDAAGGGNPAGNSGDIQLNLDGAFGAVSSFRWITGELQVPGDIKLDDGGGFTTTIQCVTPTRNNTISFPDQTGTVALVGGSTGQLVYNLDGSYQGVSTMTFDGTSVTLAGRLINSYTSLASAPAKHFTGSWFTGGTSTTTKPHFLIEPAGTTSTAWSASGTGLGVNAPSGFTGNLLDLQLNGSSSFVVNRQGSVTWNGVLVTSAAEVSLAVAGSNRLRIFSSSFRFRSPDITHFGWATDGGFGTMKTAFWDEGAGIFAQRNSTNAQSSRIYNTFTTDTNFERAKIEWASNILRIGTEKGADGGTARDMEFQTDGVTRITLKANGAILFSGIPTTNPNVAGQLWNDGGTLKISAG